MASNYKPHKHFGAKAQIVLDSLVFDQIFDVEILVLSEQWMTGANHSVLGGSINAWQLMSGDWNWKYQVDRARLEGQGVDL